ncbi:MAG: outer membrane beta-barrel protein [Cytophagales bacterium]|nr:outer membrane beta-barrel protein [Cytophagales bacterium]
MNLLTHSNSLLIMTGTVQSQNVNFRNKGGLNAYTIKGDNSSSFDPKYSFHVGLLGHIHMSDEIAIQPEVYYSAQGTQYKSNGTDYRIQPELRQCTAPTSIHVR